MGDLGTGKMILSPAHIRVAVTGIGCCSSLGQSAEEIVSNLESGTTTFRESPLLAGTPVCPILDEGNDAAVHVLQQWRHRRYLNRPGRLAVLAGLRAAYDSGLSSLPEETVLISTAAPALDFTAEKGLPPADTGMLDALWLLRWLPNTQNTVLSRFLHLHGEGLTVVCACASSLQALGEAWIRISSGLADTALVACGDSRLSLGGLTGYAKAHTLAPCPAQTAERPFDTKRSGFVPGEGGAAFFLERLDHAYARGAHIYCELMGFAASLDGNSLTAPDSTGKYAESAVRKALACAELSPRDIEWVAAHGTGTALNDAIEKDVLERVFTQNGAHPRITALKSWIGHCSSSCGALELALILLAGTKGCFPHIRLLETPVSDTLNFVTSLLQLDRQPGIGLVESFGFGGQNAAVLVRPTPRNLQQN